MRLNQHFTKKANNAKKLSNVNVQRTFICTREIFHTNRKDSSLTISLYKMIEQLNEKGFQGYAITNL